MLSFCGIDYTTIDSNGRIRFSPKVLADFMSRGTEVVLLCLPEGAVAVYPEETYLKIREARSESSEQAAGSFVGRQVLRRSGAWSQSQKITAQGRITIPQAFREFAGFGSGAGKLVAAGVEIGIELWSVPRWEEEQKRQQEHDMQKREQEMQQDLHGAE